VYDKFGCLFGSAQSAWPPRTGNTWYSAPTPGPVGSAAAAAAMFHGTEMAVARRAVGVAEALHGAGHLTQLHPATSLATPPSYNNSTSDRKGMLRTTSLTFLTWSQ